MREIPLWDYQKRAKKELLKTGDALLWGVTGSGKTRVITSILAPGDAVVAPKMLHKQWKRELVKFGLADVSLYHYMVNDINTKFHNQIMLDECHLLPAINCDRGLAYWRWLHLSARRVFVSATPFAENPDKAWWLEFFQRGWVKAHTTEEINRWTTYRKWVRGLTTKDLPTKPVRLEPPLGLIGQVAVLPVRVAGKNPQKIADSLYPDLAKGNDFFYFSVCMAIAKIEKAVMLSRAHKTVIFTRWIEVAKLVQKQTDACVLTYGKAAQGLDLGEYQLCILLDLPLNNNELTQVKGRIGRAGSKGGTLVPLLAGDDFWWNMIQDPTIKKEDLVRSLNG